VYHIVTEKMSFIFLVKETESTLPLFPCSETFAYRFLTLTGDNVLKLNNATWINQ